jgi:hypothetical protein
MGGAPALVIASLRAYLRRPFGRSYLALRAPSTHNYAPSRRLTRARTACAVYGFSREAAAPIGLEVRHDRLVGI